MKNKIRTFAKYVFVPILLLFLWLFLGIIFNPDSSITVISYSTNRNFLTHWNTKELLKGEYVEGFFSAKEDNLGILAFRFNTFHRINSDKVIFKIKEKGENNWYYTNIYKVDQFQPDEYFTFGFPLINNSKGKVYDFVIESTKGKKGDAVAVSIINPPFVTKYQFDKHLLLHNVPYALHFAVEKVISSLKDANFYMASFIYLIPFLFYIFWLYTGREPVLGKCLLAVAIIGLVILIGISSDIYSNFMLIFLAALWMMLAVFYQVTYSYTFLISALLLIITPVSLINNQSYFAERMAIVSYWFILLGSMQLGLEIVLEQVRRKKKYEKI